MKQNWKYIVFSLLILAASFRQAKAQQKDLYIPSAVRVGVDAAGITSTLLNNGRTKYGVEADVDFNRFYLVGDYGKSTLQISEPSFDYKNDGNFYRIGVDVDFLPYNKDYSVFFFGVRYAGASFSEQLTRNVPDSLYGGGTVHFQNPSVTAHWIELTSGLKVRLIGQVYMGYTFHVALDRKITGSTNIYTYDIPGFGKAQFKNRWSFDYYIYYRIPWRKKTLPVRDLK